MSRRNAQEFNNEQGATSRSLRGMLRRMAIKLTRRATAWQLLGHRIKGEQQETVDAEPFTGIGFYARPRETSNAEAVLAQIGEARHVAIIALRDEDLRKLVAGEFTSADVTALFNSQSIVVATSSGKVQAKSIGGTAKAVAYHDELVALRDWIKNTMVIATPSGNSTPGTVNNPPTSDGTSVFEAE